MTLPLDFLLVSGARPALAAFKRALFPLRLPLLLTAADGYYRLVSDTDDRLAVSFSMPNEMLARNLARRMSLEHPELSVAWWSTRRIDRSFASVEDFVAGACRSRAEESLFLTLATLPSAAPGSPCHWHPLPDCAPVKVTLELSGHEHTYVHELLSEALDGVLADEPFRVVAAAQAATGLSLGARALFWEDMRRMRAPALTVA